VEEVRNDVGSGKGYFLVRIVVSTPTSFKCGRQLNHKVFVLPQGDMWPPCSIKKYLLLWMVFYHHLQDRDLNWQYTINPLYA
jgi:hypothetical protein